MQTNNGIKGGLLKGDAHSDPSGGIRALVVTDNNRPVLLENNEVIINEKSVKDPAEHVYKGTNKEVLSQINTQHGGVPIMADGGNINKKRFLFGGRIGSARGIYPGQGFMDKNNNWRFEISDNNGHIKAGALPSAKILPGSGPIKLGSFYEHVEAFRYYPDFKKITVEFEPYQSFYNYIGLQPSANFPTVSGALEYRKNFSTVLKLYKLIIYIDHEKSKKLTESALHNYIARAIIAEIQHAIQLQEGYGEEHGIQHYVREIKKGIEAKRSSLNALPKNDVHRLALEYEVAYYDDPANLFNMAEKHYDDQFLEQESKEAVERMYLSPDQRKLIVPLIAKEQFSNGGNTSLIHNQLPITGKLLNFQTLQPINMELLGEHAIKQGTTITDNLSQQKFKVIEIAGNGLLLEKAQSIGLPEKKEVLTFEQLEMDFISGAISISGYDNTPQDRKILHLFLKHLNQEFELGGKIKAYQDAEAARELSMKKRKRFATAMALNEDDEMGEGGTVEPYKKYLEKMDSFELGTPAVHHFFNYNGDPREESGEVVMNQETYQEIINGQRSGPIYQPRTVKGISLYGDESNRAIANDFIIPNWNNVESFGDETRRQQRGGKFKITKIKYEDGGYIKNQYEGITANDAHKIWEAWTEDQREHFITDHADKVKDWATHYDDKLLPLYKYVNYKYEDLHKAIKEQLWFHISEGQYGKGATIKNLFNKAKKVAVIGYKKAKHHTVKGYHKGKKYAKDKIHDKKKDIALDVIDKTKDKVSGNDKKMILKGAENIVEEQFGKGGKIDKRFKSIEKKLNSKGVKFIEYDEQGIGINAEYKGHPIEGESYYKGDDVKMLPESVNKLIAQYNSLTM
jgi:hypothetical protein